MVTQTPEAPRPAARIRIFVADNREFPDPDPSLSVEDIQKMLTDFLPELHNAEVKETEKDNKRYIQFIKTCGSKG